MIMYARIITMLCATLSLLLTNNAAALHTNYHLQASNDLANDCQLHHAALPRKLMVNKKVEGTYEAKGLVSSKDQNKPSSGDSNKNREEVDVMMHATKGTRQEWIEGSERTHHEFFTMDYSHVRRRRPIHNKSSPKTFINSP